MAKFYRPANIEVALLFEPRDLWIGVYWDRTLPVVDTRYHAWRYRLYLCLVPMLALRISWTMRHPRPDLSSRPLSERSVLYRRWPVEVQLWPKPRWGRIRRGQRFGGEE